MNNSFRHILLLNPPSGLYRRDDRCQSKVEDQTVRIVFPPIDLATLAAIALRIGVKTWIRDYPAIGKDWDNLQHDLGELQPDVVLFNVTSATINQDLEVVRLVRKNNDHAIVFARGEFFERNGDDLQAEKTPDIALYGEAEENFERLLQGELPQNIEGLLYRNDSGTMVRREGRPVVSDLDRLPLPARDLLDNSLYRSPETGNPLTVIKANRGCFAHCIFCPAGSISDHKLRLRSTESVMSELDECVNVHGIREFLFDGDTFTANKKWLIELCEKIISSRLKIRWGCNSRVDTMDEDRARAMHRAGCWVVAFGIESGDQGMLDKMRKGTRLDQAERAVKICREVGLAVHTFFIIGLPWENKETLNATQRFLRRLNPDFFDINIATPLPGTDYYEIARAEGLITIGDKGSSYAQAGVRSNDLSAEYLTRWRRRTLLHLYMRPSYIAKTLRRAARTGTLKHYLKAAAGRLKSLLR